MTDNMDSPNIKDAVDSPLSASSPSEPSKKSVKDLVINNPLWNQMKFTDFSVSVKAVVAEIICMTLFVYVGLGTAVFFSPDTAVSVLNAKYMDPPEGPALTSNKYTESSTLGDVDLGDLLTLQQTSANFGITVALAFGFAIAVLVYCVAHISGGQLNPAVSFGLFLTGKMGLFQCIANTCAQLAGSLLGSGLLYATIPNAPAGAMGANEVAEGFNNGQAYLGEMCMTCLLVFTVLMTATDPKAVAKNMAPLVIGLSVFLGHCVLIPIDGCSINPARSFGPAVVAGHFRNFWVFIVGPYSGALLAAVMHMVLTVWHFDTNTHGKSHADKLNDISNDNCGLDDAALRM